MGSNTSVPANYDAPAYGVLSVFLVLTVVAVVARACSRRIQKSTFGADDALAYVAFTSNTASLINNFLVVSFGAINLQRLMFFTPADAHSFQQRNCATAVLYVVTITCAKLSVLFLYRRIFGMFHEWFKAFWIFNVLVVFPFWALATLAIVIWLQVQTFAFADPGNIYGSAAATLINALSDIMVLVMPITSVLKLQLSLKTKAEVIGVFCLGLITTAISLARAIMSFAQTLTSTNPAYFTYAYTILSLAESSAAVMCACIPVARPFFFKIGEFASQSISSLRLTSRSSSKGGKSDWSNSSSSTSKSKDAISRTVAIDVESVPLKETESARESLHNANVLGFNERRDPVTTISSDKHRH